MPKKGHENGDTSRKMFLFFMFFYEAFVMLHFQCSIFNYIVEPEQSSEKIQCQKIMFHLPAFLFRPFIIDKLSKFTVWIQIPWCLLKSLNLPPSSVTTRLCFCFALNFWPQLCGESTLFSVRKEMLIVYSGAVFELWPRWLTSCNLYKFENM